MDQVFVVELTVVILLFVHATGLSIKTAFNLVKINWLFRIMLLIQWSVIVSIIVGRVVIVFGEIKIYTPSVFRIYADIYGWRTHDNVCNKLNP